MIIKWNANNLQQATNLVQIVVYYDGASPSTLQAYHCEALSNSFDHLPSPSKYYIQFIKRNKKFWDALNTKFESILHNTDNSMITTAARMELSKYRRNIKDKVPKLWVKEQKKRHLYKSIRSEIGSSHWLFTALGTQKIETILLVLLTCIWDRLFNELNKWPCFYLLPSVWS